MDPNLANGNPLAETCNPIPWAACATCLRAGRIREWLPPLARDQAVVDEGARHPPPLREPEATTALTEEIVAAPAHRGATSPRTIAPLRTRTTTARGSLAREPSRRGATDGNHDSAASTTRAGGRLAAVRRPAHPSPAWKGDPAVWRAHPLSARARRRRPAGERAGAQSDRVRHDGPARSLQ